MTVRIYPERTYISRGAVGIVCLRLGNIGTLGLWGVLVGNPATDALAVAPSFNYFRRIGEVLGFDAELLMGAVALALAATALVAAVLKKERVYEGALLAASVFWGVLLFACILSFETRATLTLVFYLVFTFFSLAGWSLSDDRLKLP